jgi:hypothetical protein
VLSLNQTSLALSIDFDFNLTDQSHYFHSFLSAMI